VKFVFVKKHTRSRSQAAKGRRYKVNNWSEYNRSLKSRGSITVWLNTESLNQWYYIGKTQRGAQYQYSETCIELCFILRKVYRLPLRQTEGFIVSILQLADIELHVPDYTVICRRIKSLKVDLGVESKLAKGEKIDIALDATGLKVYGEGEWKVRQHGYSKHRTWRKLHIGIDPNTGLIHAQKLTLNSQDDSSLVESLIEQVKSPINKFLGDGIYDTRKAYNALTKRKIQPIIPPRPGARISRNCEKEDAFYQRNDSIRSIRRHGKKRWKKATGYHQRSKVETTMFRYKTTFGDHLQSRDFERQQVETQIGCEILNKFTILGRPVTSKN
jgi:hypothetical protein